MQPGSTAADFLSLVEESRLLPPGRLAPYLDPGASPTGVAGRLVRDGLLTPFQAKVLLRGRAQGFFLTSKYKILDHLGTGGMGRVFLCEHLLLYRLVAVKVLGVTPGGPLPTQGVVERFYREARAVATLDHKNIVRVFDVDTARGAPFMVMEYVDGVDLHRYTTAHGPLPTPQAADYARQAADGLQHAHEAGLVHRDVKPGNLLVDRTGVVRLLDLGLARFHADTRRNQAVTERFDPNLVLGTADFMAPEQAVDSSKVDIRADVYSLGCTLYFLLTGKPVFEAETLAQKMVFHQLREPTPVVEHRPEVPEGLAAVVRRMMAKQPADRYQTPAEVSAALAPFAVPPPGPPRSALMPKLAVGSFQLGLSPQPGPGSLTPVPRPAPRPTPQAPPPDTIRVPGPDTPRSEVSQEVVPPTVPDPATPVRRRRWVWGAAVAGTLVAATALAVVFWPAGQPDVVNPPPNGAKKDPGVPQVPVRATLTAGGSSFVRPIIDHWTPLYKEATGVEVRYDGFGSSKGIAGVLDGSLAFGCTDAPLTAEQLKAVGNLGRRVVHVPLVLGAVVPIYNLPEVGAEQLVFTGPVLADVYLGRITHWDDEAIRANNPRVRDRLPSRPIRVVYRSDGSGTTYIWSDYLSAFRPEVKKGTSVKWPDGTGTGAVKSEGVTDAVNRAEGSIGYVELSHALAVNLRYGLVRNRAGEVVRPTFENLTAAAASLENRIPDDLVFSLVDRTDGAGSASAYPITGATWAVVTAPAGGKPDPEVLRFLEWATHAGQKYATDLRYAPLPANFRDKLDALFYRELKAR